MIHFFADVKILAVEQKTKSSVPCSLPLSTRITGRLSMGTGSDLHFQVASMPRDSSLVMVMVFLTERIMLEIWGGRILKPKVCGTLQIL